MADGVILLAVRNLGEFLSQQIVLRQNVGTNLEWHRAEFGYMHSFIKDAEEIQARDHRVQQWISEITDVAYDTVSILEDFTLRIEDVGGAPNSGFVNRLRMCACICCKEAKLCKIAKEIESVKKRVLDISRRRETYGIRNIGDAGEGSSRGSNKRLMIKTLRRATSYVDEEQFFVGFEDVIEKLLNEILKHEPRRSTVSVVGMGGLGKTSVARKLYNSSAVVETFPYHAWVCVSQEYSVTDLLRTITKSFRKGINKQLEMLENMTAEDLEREIRQTLEGHRYLIVVDDVWHREAWQSLKRAFPDCKNGSRVIITTRKKDVAIRADDRCFVHELRFLTPHESWELFCKRLSCREDYANWCSVAMVDLGREMVKKCGGLPLAIIVLGGLLAHKTRLQEWQKVKEHLWQHMKNDSVEIYPLLSLSYNDLPIEIKQCFLYLGIFPEDSLIKADKLMWLWIAEGFIDGQGLEDIAEDYLNELIDRCLIQVAESFSPEAFKCRIHDLLRDLAVGKAKEVSFFDIYDPQRYTVPSISRRLAIHNHINNYLSRGIYNKKLRSILFFHPDPESLKLEELKSVCQNFKYLSVLDLGECSYLYHAPESIGSLIHLRYLGLRRTNISKLPESIGNLKSLQILDAVTSCRPFHIPPEISKLINLRHIISRFDGYVNLGTLTNLRTLRYVRYDQWVKIDKSNLINLQKLAIENIVPVVSGEFIFSLDSVSQLKSLRDLSLECHALGFFPSLEPLSQCQCLLKLRLDGTIDEVASLKHLPESITDLCLSSSQFEEDPMPILEKLLNLRSLEMRTGSFTGKEIVCGAKGFPQLEFLHLCGLHNLEKWDVQNEALPVMRGLGIYKCPKLKMVPERLQSVSVLKEVKEIYKAFLN